MKRLHRRPVPPSALPFIGTVVVAILAAWALLATDLTVQAADALSDFLAGPNQVLPGPLFK